MLMTNPSGEHYNVIHPTRNEVGNVLVPPGYWRATGPVFDWEVVDPRNSTVVWRTNWRSWGILVAWFLGHGCECLERVEWADVGEQRYELTAWDPESGIWRELP